MLKAISVFGYLAMVGGVIGLLYARSLFSSHPVVIVLQIAALALMVWARITFGRRSFHLAANPTKGGLVTSGPYRFIRHPIYTAVCLFVVPGVAAHWSLVAGLWCVLIVSGALVRMLLEEKLLVTLYPEYRDYAAKTPRMIPFIF